MNDDTPPPPTGPQTERDAASARRSRWSTIAVIAVVVAVGVAVVRSAISSSVPVGAAGPGSSLPRGDADRLALTMRDADGREVRLPDGRPGVVVVANAGRCDACRNAVRAARDAVARSAAGAQLIVVMGDAATTRPEVAAFARSVGSPPARYVIDDRNGGLTSMLRVGQLGDALVYDRSGRVVARPDLGSRQLTSALRSARR